MNSTDKFFNSSEDLLKILLRRAQVGKMQKGKGFLVWNLNEAWVNEVRAVVQDITENQRPVSTRDRDRIIFKNLSYIGFKEVPDLVNIDRDSNMRVQGVYSLFLSNPLLMDYVERKQGIIVLLFDPALQEFSGALLGQEFCSEDCDVIVNLFERQTIIDQMAITIRTYAKEKN